MLIGVTGNALTLTALDGRPAVATVAAVAERALRTLPRSERPSLSERLVANELVISFAPQHQPQTLAVAASFTSGFALSNSRWTELDARLQQIQEPHVPTAISAVALRTVRHTLRARR